MLGLGLVSLLTLSAILFLRENGDSAKVSQERSRLKDSFEQIQKVLSEDLQSAIYLDGYSALRLLNEPLNSNGFSGVRTFTINDQPALQIIRPRHSSFSITAQPNTEPPEVFLSIANASNAQEGFQHQVFEYFEKALSVYEHYVLKGPDKSNIVKRSSLPSLDPDQQLIEVSLDSSFAGTIDYSELLQPVDVQPLQFVLYFIDDKGSLIREVRKQPDFNQEYDSRQVVTKNIHHWDLSFRFRETPEMQIQNLELAVDNAYYPDPQSTACVAEDLAPSQSCPEYQHASQIKVSLSLQSDHEFQIASSSQASDSGFFLDSDSLFYNRSFVLGIGNHAFGTELNQIAGVSWTCSVTDHRSYCNPDCAHKFQNPDPEADDWIGYGQFKGHDPNDPEKASDFCLCQTDEDGNFTSILTSEGQDDVPEWQEGATENNKRINACVRQFGCGGPGGTNWLENKHPLRYIGCRCLSPRSDYIRKNEYDPQSGELIAPGYDGDETVGSRRIQDVLDGVNSEDINCRTWHQCQLKLDDLSGAAENKVFEDHCKCKSFAAYDTGQSSVNEMEIQGISPMSLRLDLLCNLEFLASNDPELISCPDTMEIDQDGPLFISQSLEEATPSETALRPETAKLCGLISQIPTTEFEDRFLFSQPDKRAKMSLWDLRDAAGSVEQMASDEFRQMLGATDISLGYSMPTTFGSTQFLQAATRFKDKATDNIFVDPSANAGELWNDLNFGGINKNYTDESDLQDITDHLIQYYQDRPDLTEPPSSEVLERRAFCRPYAYSRSYSGHTTYEIKVMRALLTKNFDPSDPTEAELPEWCGGLPGQSGLPGQ